MSRVLVGGGFRMNGDVDAWLRKSLSCCALLFGVALAGRAVAVTAIWIGPASGSWNTAANWSTGAVPNNSANVHIDDNAAQNSTVTSSTNIDNVPLLTIDPGDSLIASSGIGPSTLVEINGTLNISGPMFGSANVLGTGRIEMPASNSALTDLYYVAPGGLVRGRGSIGVSLDSHNDGEIRADIPGQLLTISLQSSATIANLGRLTAVGGGALKVVGSNSATVWGGRIECNPGSTVTLGLTSGSGGPTNFNDVTIAGNDDTDPLTSVPVITFVNGSLVDPTFEGSFSVPTGSAVGFTGLVTNKAQITMAPATSSPYFFPATDTQLTGGGSFLMQEGFLFSGTSGTTHLYNLDNTIHGTGTITAGFGFTNRGTINADVASSLSLNLTNADPPASTTDVNSGTIRSTGGGYLRMGFITLQNYEGTTPGKVIAGQNSVVELNAATISGGIVQCEGTVAATQGRFRIIGSSVFQDVTVQGTFRTTSNAAAAMSGQVNNQGVIAAPIGVSGSNSLQLNGTGEVLIDTTWLSMTTGRLTNQQNLIHGSGTTTATGTFINHSTVRADGTLTFTAGGLKLSNSGRLEAGPGGTLDLSKLDVTNVDGTVRGTVFAANGGTVLLGAIHGGTLATDGTGVIKIGTGTFNGLDSVRNTGNLQTSGAKIFGNLTNDGMMTGTISMYQFVQISGTGTWDATGTGAFPLGLLVNGPQHTILGDGPLSLVAFRNEGTVTAKGTSVFTLGAYTIQNYGLIDTPLGTTFAANALGSTIDNEGTLRSAGAMTLTATEGFTNHGTGVVDITGTLSMLQSTTLRNGAGGLVKGSGTISRSGGGAALVNQGIVAPGDGIKTLSISGDFQQLATGRLKMDIDTGPALTNDVLAIDGAASLAGALEVLLPAGDSVTIGDSFKLLTATQGVSGIFNDLALPALGSGMFWNVQYSPNDVRVTAMALIPGDYNRDAVVDGSDFLIWRRSLGSNTNLAADGNANGMVDDGDYDVWRAHFGQTAGSGSGAGVNAAVPEPTSLMLLLFAATFWSLRRNRTA